MESCHGPIFDERQSSRLEYCRHIRERQKSATESYTNDLHEALLQKKQTAFWKCWHSKIDSKYQRKCNEIEGSGDSGIIVNKFAQHFSNSFSYNDPEQMKQVALLWQRDRATRLSVEILQLKYPYRMALFA